MIGKKGGVDKIPLNDIWTMNTLNFDHVTSKLISPQLCRETRLPFFFFVFCFFVTWINLTRLTFNLDPWREARRSRSSVIVSAFPNGRPHKLHFISHSAAQPDLDWGLRGSIRQVINKWGMYSFALPPTRVMHLPGQVFFFFPPLCSPCLPWRPMTPRHLCICILSRHLSNESSGVWRDAGQSAAPQTVERIPCQVMTMMPQRFVYWNVWRHAALHSRWLTRGNVLERRPACPD